MGFDAFWQILTGFDTLWHVLTQIYNYFFPNRQDIQCFGDETCYSLAFGVPAVLMLIATGILVIGKNLWIKGLLKFKKAEKSWKLFFMASNIPKYQWFFALISALASKIITIKFLNLNVIIFWPKKVKFKSNIDIFLTFMLIYILVQTLEFTQIPAFYLFFPCKYYNKRRPSKVAYFSKICCKFGCRSLRPIFCGIPLIHRFWS